MDQPQGMDRMDRMEHPECGDHLKNLQEEVSGLIDHFPMEEKELRPYSALAFAYIGDSVFDLIVKTFLVTRGYDRPNHYHAKAIHYVSAAAQTRMMDAIKPLLTEEERNIFRRGRNSKMISPAKNQTPHDYRVATGFEALLGYLYLSGRYDRMMELARIAIASLDDSDLDIDQYTCQEENEDGL